ncbi:hypothetical protein KJY73_03695 [Bowmanella sp. Y26]|nr:hypothetical protein [Bowmanella yangjiangensis]
MLLLFAAIGLLMAIFVVFPVLLYLKGKPMRDVEDALEGGIRFFSLNIFMAGHGALHYGSLFLFDRPARRYKVLEKRADVPVRVRWWFKLYFVLFMTSAVLFLGPSTWLYLDS